MAEGHRSGPHQYARVEMMNCGERRAARLYDYVYDFGGALRGVKAYGIYEMGGIRLGGLHGFDSGFASDLPQVGNTLLL